MGKFEIYQDKRDQYRFRLKASNGQIILASEGYTAKTSCENGIASVKTHAPDDNRYERLTARDGSPYFNLKSSNGQVIGTSEMYSGSSAMENGIASVKSNAPSASVDDLTSS
ncbi:MAG: YegP family protein [Algicola sp.]|nr:YegP family protein [Algicola sp.]